MRCLIIGLLGLALVFGYLGHVEAESVQWRIEDGGNGHWYEYRDAPNTWYQAVEQSFQASHQGTSGHLVTLSSEAENLFIYDLLPENTKCWIGLTDNEAYGGAESYEFGWPDSKTNGWAWVTGEPLEYYNWGSNEPNHGTRALGDDVVYINSSGSSTWADTSANYSDYGFVIEYTVPEPSTILSLLIGTIVLLLFNRRK